MEDTSRKDIRRLLKTFGIKADEAMVAHLARNANVDALDIRITLEDLTVYEKRPDARLHLVVEDTIRRHATDRQD